MSAQPLASIASAFGKPRTLFVGQFTRGVFVGSILARAHMGGQVEATRRGSRTVSDRSTFSDQHLGDRPDTSSHPAETVIADGPHSAGELL